MKTVAVGTPADAVQAVALSVPVVVPVAVGGEAIEFIVGIPY
jgi:hypothetical protein